MDLRQGVADLHMHTVASDGTCTVSDRVDQASERGLDAIAITDHDVISGDIDGRAREVEGLELISGVEIRADVQGIKVEILGYYVDPSEGALQGLLEEVRGYRRRRNREIASRLDETTSIEVEYDEVADRADGILGRPHFANLLVESGVVGTVGEAFDDYLGEDGEAFVPMERVPAGRVVEAVHLSGGVAVLAHPGRIRASDVEPLVEELVDVGLDGLEVAYPYSSRSDEAYADVGVGDAEEFAERYGLLKTGGSDCHGPDSGKFRIGEVRVPKGWLEELRVRAEGIDSD